MLVLFGTTAPVSGEIPTCGEFLVMWGAMFIVAVYCFIDKKYR
ncbi:hypothetical protein FF3_02258 [Fretibacterium fastidiosum]